MQEGAGELTAEKGCRTDQKRRRRVRPPRVVRPEILHCGAIDRQLIQAKRGNVEDVIEVTGVTHTDVDKQVVHQHAEQYAVDQAEDVDAHGLVFEVGLGRPQRQRRLNGAFAGQTQVHGLGVARREIQLEQVVVFFDRAAVKGQRVAGALRQFECAVGVLLIQVDMVQRRVRQLQQPRRTGLRITRLIVEIDFKPEHRMRVTGVQGVFFMGLQTFRMGHDIGDGRLPGHIFIDVHLTAQGQALSGFVKGDCAGQRWQPAHQENKKIAHTAPKWPARLRLWASFPFETT